jgi:WD40 repeat protein
VLPEGRLVSGSRDNTLKIWRELPDDDAKGGGPQAAWECVHTLGGHSFVVYCVLVLPDGRLVSGSRDNSLKIWRERTDDEAKGGGPQAEWECVHTLWGHSDSVCCVTVLPDGRLVSGSDDYSLKIFDSIYRRPCP